MDGGQKEYLCVPDPQCATELAGKKEKNPFLSWKLLLTYSMSSYSLLFFLFFSLPSTPVAAPALSVIGEARGARDVSRHKDIPAPNISRLMPNRGQSRGNLKCSLKDTEFTWLLLTFFFFFLQQCCYVPERHVRFTCPAKVHILVQAGVSDQSNSVSKWSFFTQTALLGILPNAVTLSSN